MKSNWGYFIILCVLFFQSCNPQETKSLLTTFEVCSEDCTTAEQTQIEGELSIDPENSQMSFNVDKGNLVEISGTCKDLGRKNNRIIVNAFEVEDDESGLPYVDNTISSSCQTNVLGMTTAQQCVFVTHGKGLTESGQVYPQCINGRFSFMVRVGNVSKVAAVVKNYLVRMKLRTTDGLTSESGWARTAIKREVSVPNFTLTTDSTNLRCEVKTEGFKFKHSPFDTDNIPDITYMVKRDSSGYSAAGAVLTQAKANRFSAFQSYSDLSQSDFGDSVANFYDDGLTHIVLSLNPSGPPQPGVKYNYYVQARAGADDSAESSAKVCEQPAPFLGSVTTSATVCSVSLTTGANSAFQYIWNYSTAANWTSAQANGSATGCGTLPETCNFTMPVTPGTYFVAVRTFDIATSTYGKWSNEVQCKKP